jgi:hypothetical protein
MLQRFNKFFLRLASQPLVLLFALSSFTTFFDLFRLHNSTYHVSLGPLTVMGFASAKIAFGVLLTTCMVILYNHRPLRMPYHVFLLFILVVYGATLGAMNILMGVEYIDWEAYSSHAISFGGIFLSFWAASVHDYDKSVVRLKRIDKFACATVIVHMIVVFGAFIAAIPQGITCVAATAVACWLLVRNKPIWLLIETGTIILAGKRTMMFSLLFGILVLAYLIRNDRPQITQWVLGILASFILIVAVGLHYYHEGTFENNSVLNRPFSRISTLIENAEGGDASKASAGRSDEIVNTWAIFGRDKVRIAAGSGFGWWYPFYDMQDEEGNTFRRHYTHFSPLVFFYTFGVLGFCLFVYLVAYVARKIASVFSSDIAKDPVLLVMLTYNIARYFEGLSGATWHSDNTNWFLLGFLAGYAVRTLRRREVQQLTPNLQPELGSA